MASNRSSVRLTLAPVVTMKVHLTPTFGSSNSSHSVSPSSRHYSNKNNTSHFCSVLDADHKYAENVDLEFNKLIECIEEKISDDDDGDDSVGGFYEEDGECLLYQKGKENEGNEELVTKGVTLESAKDCKVGNRSPPTEEHILEEHVLEEQYQQTEEGERKTTQLRNLMNSIDITTASGSKQCHPEKTHWNSINDRRPVGNHGKVLIENLNQDMTSSRIYCSPNPSNQINFPVANSSSIIINKEDIRRVNNSLNGFDSKTSGKSATTNVSSVSITPISSYTFTTKPITISEAASSSTAIVMTTDLHGESSPGVSTVSINPVSACPFTTKAVATLKSAAASSTAIAMTTDQYTKPVDEKTPLIETSASLPVILTPEMEFVHSDPPPVNYSNSSSIILSTSDNTKESYNTPSISTLNFQTSNVGDNSSISRGDHQTGVQSRSPLNQPHELQVIIPISCNVKNNDDYYYDDDDDSNPPPEEVAVPSSSLPEEKSYSSSISLLTSSSCSLDVADEGSSGDPAFTPFWCTLSPVLGTAPVSTTNPSVNVMSRNTENLNNNSSCPAQRKQAQVYFHGPMSHTLVPKVVQSQFEFSRTGPVNKTADTATTTTVNKIGYESETGCISLYVHPDGPITHTILNPEVRPTSQYPHTGFVNKAVQTSTKTLDNVGNPASNFITSHVVNTATTSTASTTTTIVFTSSKEPEHDTTTTARSTTSTTATFPATCVELGRGYSLQGDCKRNKCEGDDDEVGYIGSTVDYSPSTNCYFCKTPMTDTTDKSARLYLAADDEDSGYYYNINVNDEKKFSRECPSPQEYQTQEEGTMLKSSVDLYLENVWSPSGVTLEGRKPRVRDITRTTEWKENKTSTDKMDNEDITNQGISSRFTLGRWEKVSTRADDNNNNSCVSECSQIGSEKEDDGYPTMKEFQLDNGRNIMRVISLKKDSVEEADEDESLITSPSYHPPQSVQKVPLRNENQSPKIVNIEVSKPREVKKDTEPRFETSTSTTQFSVNKMEEKTLSNINLGSKPVEDSWVRKTANSNLMRRAQPKERNSVRRMTQAIESEISKSNSFSNSAVDVAPHKKHSQVDALQRYKPRRYKSDPFGQLRPRSENSEQTTFRSHIETISTGTHSENAKEQLMKILSRKTESESNQTNTEQTTFTRRHIDSVSTRKTFGNTNQEVVDVSSGRNENESNKHDTFTQVRPQISKVQPEKSEQTTFTRRHCDTIPMRVHSGNTNEQIINIVSRRNENCSMDLENEFPMREFIIKTNDMGRSSDRNFNVIGIEERLPVFGSPASNSSPISWSLGSSSTEHSQTVSDSEKLSKSLIERGVVDCYSPREVDSLTRGYSGAGHSKTTSNKGHVASPERSLPEKSHLSQAETESCTIRIGERSSAFISPVSNSSPIPWSRGSSSTDYSQTMSEESQISSLERNFTSSTEKVVDHHASRTETDTCTKDTDETDTPIVRKTTEIRLQLCPPKTSVRLKSPSSVNQRTSLNVQPISKDTDSASMTDIDHITSCVVTDADIGHANQWTINGNNRSGSHLVVKETFISPSEDENSQTSNCHRKPVFLSALKDIECVAGERLTLRCEVVGWPEPEVSWKFDEIILDEQESYTSDYDGRVATLQLPELLPTDEGIYTCLAQNDVGRCETNAILSVLGFAPDIYEPLDSVKAQLGLSVSLQCRMKAKPRPKVYWSLDGQRLEENPHIRFSNSEDLYIMNISQCKTENAGCYEFRAINPFGDAMCTAYISIEDPKVQKGTESDMKSIQPEVTNIVNTLSKKMSFSHVPKTFVSKEHSPGERCQVKDVEIRAEPAETKCRSVNLDLVDSTSNKELMGQSMDQSRSKEFNRNIAALSSGISTMMNRASRDLDAAFQEVDSEEELVSFAKSSLSPKSSSQITHSTTTTFSTRQIITSCGDILQTTTTTMTSYDDIDDEDQLHEMMTKVEDFEDRKKIRTRIREIREKKMKDGTADSKPAAAASTPADKTPSETKPAEANKENIDKTDGAVEKAAADDKPKETTETTSVTSKDGKTTTVTTVQTIEDKNETRVITTEVVTKTMADGGTSTKTSKRTKIIQHQMGPGGAMAARGGLAPGGRGRGVTRSPSAIKQMLLEWTKAMTQEYSDKIAITNFSSSWNNGLAFCALIHHFYPDAFDFDALDPKKRRHNFDLAFDTAEKLADIAPLLDTDDMVRMKNPDWKCVFTYVQSFYRKLQSHERNKAMPRPESL